MLCNHKQSTVGQSRDVVMGYVQKFRRRPGPVPNSLWGARRLRDMAEHVNGLFVGQLRRLVHYERLTIKWASDTVLPLINHIMAVSPNLELVGLSPAELKFGTGYRHRYPPGHSCHDFVRRTYNTRIPMCTPHQTPKRHSLDETEHLSAR